MYVYYSASIIVSYSVSSSCLPQSVRRINEESIKKRQIFWVAFPSWHTRYRARAWQPAGYLCCQVFDKPMDHDICTRMHCGTGMQACMNSQACAHAHTAILQRRASAVQRHILRPWSGSDQRSADRLVVGGGIC